MKRVETALPEVFIIEPQVFGDSRGLFYESYNKRTLAELGVTGDFVQDNHSRSARNVLRGLHYQVQRPQGKLVRVVAGEVFDIAVDLRRSSSTFGRWVGFNLSSDNKHMAWIPPGFGHGFIVLSDYAEYLYKTTDYYAPEYERCILWNDPAIGIEWPVQGAPILSAKDQQGKRLHDAELFT